MRNPFSFMQDRRRARHQSEIPAALGGKPVYAGTVSKAVIAHRRATNKRARAARRTHRRAAR